jgi:flavin reductase (DIM6/NTAB) family NADH-FMN oxidoreductase RutF
MSFGLCDADENGSSLKKSAEHKERHELSVAECSGSSLRRIMGHFVHTVTIVTTGTESTEAGGMTVTTVCGVSLEPPLVSVCIRLPSRTHDLMLASRIFVVNILDKRQTELAERFAGPCENARSRFDGIQFWWARSGAPILTNCLGFLECKLAKHLPVGDHAILVGRVMVVESIASRKPLLRYRGHYFQMTPSEPLIQSLNERERELPTFIRKSAGVQVRA